LFGVTQIRTGCICIASLKGAKASTTRAATVTDLGIFKNFQSKNCLLSNLAGFVINLETWVNLDEDMQIHYIGESFPSDTACKNCT
jgi:hypothetical protein